MKRGEIYRADLDPVIGSEQGGIRPVLIIQNDIGNLHSPTVIVAAITSRLNKPKLPTHVAISSRQSGLKKDSVILAEQVRTLEKKRLMEKLGRVDEEVMAKVDRALAISLGSGAGLPPVGAISRAEEAPETERCKRQRNSTPNEDAGWQAMEADRGDN